MFICDQCVALCNEIINEPPPRTTQGKAQEWVSLKKQNKSWWRRLFRIEGLQPV